MRKENTKQYLDKMLKLFDTYFKAGIIKCFSKYLQVLLKQIKNRKFQQKEMQVIKSINGHNRTKNTLTTKNHTEWTQ